MNRTLIAALVAASLPALAQEPVVVLRPIIVLAQAEAAREEARHAREKAREDAQRAREEAQRAREAAREEARRARERAREDAQHAREAAHAQAEIAREQADIWRRWAEDFSREMRASMGTLFAPHMTGAVVKGAPYSAEAITETRQQLADGNVISRHQTSLVYRDGEGRTRQETGGDGKEPNVYINDPVEGKHYVLMPGSKRVIASRSHAPRPMAFTHHDRNRQVVRVGGTEIRVEDGKVLVNGKEVSQRYETTSASGRKVVVENGRITIDGKPVGFTGKDTGTNVVVNTVQGPDGVKREEVRVHVVRAGDDGEIPVPPIPPRPPRAAEPPGAPLPGVAPPAPRALPGAPTPAAAPVPPLPPLPPLPGVDVMRFESTAKLGKGVTTSLGMKEFDGVKAEGTSTVWTIPAGKIGNRNAILVTSEKWYSPELKVTVYSRYHDPRTGETTYRLANIRRAEPAAELFRVPEDYEVRRRGKG